MGNIGTAHHIFPFLSEIPNLDNIASVVTIHDFIIGIFFIRLEPHIEKTFPTNSFSHIISSIINRQFRHVLRFTLAPFKVCKRADLNPFVPPMLARVDAIRPRARNITIMRLAIL